MDIIFARSTGKWLESLVVYTELKVGIFTDSPFYLQEIISLICVCDVKCL